MIVLSGLAGAVASDAFPIPLAVLAGPDGPNADPAAGADVINTDDGESASVATGAYETRPDDEESALSSIGADDSASAVDGSATGSGVGRVHDAANRANSTNIGFVVGPSGSVLTHGGSRLLVLVVVAWAVRVVLKSVGEMVADIRRVW